jgi:hypothetical protein
MDTRITRLRAPKNIDRYEGLLETKLTEVGRSIRGWTPTSLAIDRVLHPSAASRTIRARFKSRCNVTY